MMLSYSTSTDPRLVERTAKLVSELQWPVNLDFRPALKRLNDTFDSCIERQHYVREGMIN
jgi:hypothetical protein